MIVTIIDTETTGLDPHNDRVIEVATCSYDTRFGVLDTWSTLVRPKDWDTRSTREDWGEWRVSGIEPRAVAGAVEFPNVATRGMCLAHNASFDREMLRAANDRGDLTFLDRAWADTMDLRWPVPHGTSRALTSLAVQMGVGVVRAHRAVDDVLTIAAMLDRWRERGGMLDDEIMRAQEMRTFTVRVSYDSRHLAKEMGARWNGKAWRVRLHPLDVEDTASAYGVRLDQEENDT